MLHVKMSPEGHRWGAGLSFPPPQKCLSESKRKQIEVQVTGLDPTALFHRNVNERSPSIQRVSS